MSLFAHAGLFRTVHHSRELPPDRQLMEWFALTEKPIHVLLTKAARFSRSQAALALKHAHGALRRDYAALSLQRFAGATHKV
jgi:GTP-binding protein